MYIYNYIIVNQDYVMFSPHIENIIASDNALITTKL